MTTGTNWFYNRAPQGVVVRPVKLKVRWALSTRGLRHRVVTADAAWLDGEVRYAGTWLCGDGATNITLLAEGSDDGRLCIRCKLREDWPAGPAVYSIYNASGELLYIGSTGDLGNRLYQHSAQAAWWGDNLRIDAVTHASLPLARAAEARAIEAARPPHNYLHNPARSRRQPKRVACS